MADNVWLQRPSVDTPWGFRIAGGRDYQETIKVARVTAGSIAATCLTPGLFILQISEQNTSSMTQAQANELIKEATLLQLRISKDDIEATSQGQSAGGAQVASPTQTKSPVHDLFQDMYRNTPTSPGASLPDSRPQPIATLGSRGFNTQTHDPSNITAIPTSPRFGLNSSRSNANNQIGPKLTNSSPSFLQKQESITITPKISSNEEDTSSLSESNHVSSSQIHRNYKPDTSLNSSTDSGVYSDAQQNVNRQNSNPSSLSSNCVEPSSFSSSASEISDTAYTITPTSQEDLDRSSLSPPPPLPSQPPPPPPCSDITGMDSPDFEPPLPPPPPPFESMPEEINNSSPSPWNPDQEKTTNSDGYPTEYPTKLNQQLSAMNINNYNRQSSQPGSQPTTPYGNQPAASPYGSQPAASPYGSQPAASPYGSQPTASPYGSQPTTPYGSQPASTPYSPYSPPKMRGYQSPSTGNPPQSFHSPKTPTSVGTPPQSYHSPTTAPGAPGYHPLANVAPPQAPPAPPPPPPPQPAASFNHYHSPTGAPEARGPRKSPQVAEKPNAMPDAVVNMASKGEKDKKPFAYAADMDEIKQHRERVRRKPGGIPSYQNMLNLPQFEEPKAKSYSPSVLKPQTPTTPPVMPQGPGEGVFGHSQYNSPLGMYSAKTAEETFVAQSAGLVTGVAGEENDLPKIRLPGTKETKDITQSETYKMIHGIDHAKPKPKVVMPAQTHHGRTPRQPAPDDEMTFSGVNNPESIPSRSFHRLQSMTDTEPEIDTSSIRPKNLAVDDDSVSGYNEASIRYMGKNIPSKSFRMLQNMTGGPQNPQQAMPKRRPVRQQEPSHEPESHTDEIVDISYVGGNIPSRSFKMLQQSVGQPNGNAPHHHQQQQPSSHDDYVQNPKGRTVKVVKLRSGENGKHDANQGGATDF